MAVLKGRRNVLVSVLAKSNKNLLCGGELSLTFLRAIVANGLAMRSAGFQGSDLSSRTDGSQSCGFGFKFTERKAKRSFGGL